MKEYTEYTSHIITIVIHSEVDAAQLLDIANDAAARIVDDIESYGEEAHCLEEETSVETANMVTGGRQHE
jgi:hypothetical protein